MKRKTKTVTEPATQMTVEPTDILTLLATKIQEKHDACFGAARDSVTHAIQCGVLLHQAKLKVPHGKWESWIRDNCTFGVRTAQGYMRLADKFPDLDEFKSATVAHLPLRDALAAVADSWTSEPEPVTEPELDSELDGVLRIVEGEVMTVDPDCKFCGATWDEDHRSECPTLPTTASVTVEAARESDGTVDAEPMPRGIPARIVDLVNEAYRALDRIHADDRGLILPEVERLFVLCGGIVAKRAARQVVPKSSRYGATANVSTV